MSLKPSGTQESWAPCIFLPLPRFLLVVSKFRLKLDVNTKGENVLNF